MKVYRELTDAVIRKFGKIVGKDNIISGKERMVDYSQNEWSYDWVQHFAEVAAKPKTVTEISQIIKLGDEEEFPVSPWARTGLEARSPT